MWDPERIHARLAVLRAGDTALSRFGAERHRYELGPTLSEPEVAAFEVEHHIELPESYRSFVLDVGDGGAGPYYGLFSLDDRRLPEYEKVERRQPDQLSTDFPHTTEWNAVELGEHEYGHERWSTGSLIVAEFGCGGFFRLVVSGPARGQIWFDDRASDAGLKPVGEFSRWYEEWLAGAGE